MTRSILLALSFAACALLGSLPLFGEPPARPDPPRQTKGFSADELRKLHAGFDLATWQTTEDETQLRFGLLRTASLFPTAVLPRKGAVAPLEAMPSDAVGKVRREGKEKPTLDEYLASAPVDGFLVAHRGKIVYERYPRMRPQDRHLWWSVSKSLAGTLVGLLVHEKRIDPRKPIETYIPELEKTDWKGTPVLDILDMASGMSGLEWDCPTGKPYVDPKSLYFQFESTLGILPPVMGVTASTYEYVAGLKRVRPSGRVYEYSSVNTFVLSWLIEKVTGRPYAEVAAERIWERMGAEADASLIVARGSGAPSSHGGVSSTLRDLARYGMIYTPSWKVVSREPIVPAGYLRDLASTGRAELWTNRQKEYPRKTKYAGGYVSTYHWDYLFPDGDAYKGGFQGQGLYVSPGKDLVIVFFSSGAEPREFAFALARSGLFEP
jgi:CubicO group peptidase (beta-lactamase class C family)